MTEAEALDMAAKAAGWGDYNIALYNDGDAESIRAHAATLMELAELMTTCEEATTRMELMYLQHQKVVDENAALEAKLDVARKALGSLSLVELAAEESILRDDDIVVLSFKTFRALRAALKEIDNGDR